MPAESRWSGFDSRLSHAVKSFPLAGADGMESRHFAAWLEKELIGLGCRIRSCRELATLPGSSHWHIERPGYFGTLEVTYDPASKRATISWHENRYAPWMSEVKDTLLHL